MHKILTFLVLGTLFTACKTSQLPQGSNEAPVRYPEEKHLKNIRQLTFGGDNAEAYWSFDDKKIVFGSQHHLGGPMRSNLLF